MAFPAPPSFCAEAAYQKFSSFRGFSPAKSFCSNLDIHQTSVERDVRCPEGSILCSLLAELRVADKEFAHNVCRCVGVYVEVPGITATSEEVAIRTTTGLMTQQRTTELTREPPCRVTADTSTTKSLSSATSNNECTGSSLVASEFRTGSERETTFHTLTSVPLDPSHVSSASSALSASFCFASSGISSEASSRTSSTTSSSSSMRPTSSRTAESFSRSPSFNFFPSSISSRASTRTSSATSSSTSMRPIPSRTATSPSSSSSSNIFPGSAYSTYPTTLAASTTILSFSSSSISTFPYSSSRTSTSRSSSSTAPSLTFATCTYRTASTACPTVTASSNNLAYKQYYTGAYHVENLTNPGTGGEPVVYTRFRGTYDVCSATQYCANAAGAAYGSYLSFDLHYTCSNSSWMCVQFFKGNRDGRFFDTLDSDVVVGFGYSY